MMTETIPRMILQVQVEEVPDCGHGTLDMDLPRGGARWDKARPPIEQGPAPALYLHTETFAGVCSLF
jgi:hypothetical protein